MKGLLDNFLFRLLQPRGYKSTKGSLLFPSIVSLAWNREPRYKGVEITAALEPPVVQGLALYSTGTDTTFNTAINPLRAKKSRCYTVQSEKRSSVTGRSPFVIVYTSLSLYRCLYSVPV